MSTRLYHNIFRQEEHTQLRKNFDLLHSINTLATSTLNFCRIANDTFNKAKLTPSLTLGWVV